MSYRYLGNKARIASWITDHISRVLPPGSTVADPMCGTATMSAALAYRGFRVVAADQLKFPVLHAQARLLHDGPSAFGSQSAYESVVAELNGLKPQRSLFWQEYSDQGSPINGAKPRKYFSGANAAKIDAIRAELKRWRGVRFASEAVDLLLHDLILSSNKVANIAGTYGYYRSSWNQSSLVPIVLEAGEEITCRRDHLVRQGKVEELSRAIEADGFYLDPPYTKRQYGGNYHILETLAEEDHPDPVGEGGLRNWSPQASEFCYRRKAADAFRRALSGISAKWVFISYSDDAHLSHDELLGVLSSFGATQTVRIPIERFRSNSRVAKTGAVNEKLYVLEMRNARSTGDRRALVSQDQPERSVQHRALAFG